MPEVCCRFVTTCPFSRVHARKNLAFVKNSLLTSCQEVVFALLAPSCQQVWNKLWTTCNNLVDIFRLVARLFQLVCYNLDIIDCEQSTLRRKGGTADNTSRNKIRQLFASPLSSNIIILALYENTIYSAYRIVLIKSKNSSLHAVKRRRLRSTS